MSTLKSNGTFYQPCLNKSNTVVALTLFVHVCNYVCIKTHGSESLDQGGSSKRCADRLKTHTREYIRILQEQEL